MDIIEFITKHDSNQTAAKNKIVHIYYRGSSNLQLCQYNCMASPVGQSAACCLEQILEEAPSQNSSCTATYLPSHKQSK